MDLLTGEINVILNFLSMDTRVSVVVWTVAGD